MQKKTENAATDVYEKLEHITKLLLLLFEKIEHEYSTDSRKDGYYTSSEVMETLNISENTLTKMRRLGKVEFIEISNGSYRYPKRQFAANKKVA
jgi:GTPase Era involved in 16S rRNA processing